MIGIVTKLNAYKSGKGYFIGIDGQEYMYFGEPSLSIGALVEFEEGKPSKDGKKTIKGIHLVKQIALDEDKPFKPPLYRAHDTPAKDSREEYWKNKEKRDLEKEPIITRLSCIASAVALADEMTTLEEVVFYAKRFEKYAVKGD